MEVQTSDATEEKSSEMPDAELPKLSEYNGLGRRHNDEQIDEILDAYLLYGELPKYVSDRQRLDYRKHPRLELRRLYLEQAGYFKKHSNTGKRKAVSATSTDGTNVLNLAERKTQRQRSSAKSV